VINSSSTEFTASDGRRFAFPVGTAFLLLSGLLFWREKTTAFEVTAGLGVVLYVLGATIPGKLGPVYHGWMRLALLISKVTTPIFMGITYFVVLAPVGVLMRLMGKDPMVRKEAGGSFWVTRAAGEKRRSSLQRQF
jgi:hypothetical protein